MNAPQKRRRATYPKPTDLTYTVEYGIRWCKIHRSAVTGHDDLALRHQDTVYTTATEE
ncbi:hypothetical protein [Nocardiopsis sp. MG754419]|uniref:hypothetical protein n=1 Tax=Nocardiopsis sp. MG754419 TaxID=2259865 RepID=UPI001BA75F2D|nr:hypothetical protein [Nocardiopsis sp. MG754419]